MKNTTNNGEISLLPVGIIITGLNGCGKSTVCKLLAEKLNYYSMDVEDYYFIDSDIPYSKFHTHEQTKKLMLNDIVKHNHFVLETVNCDWGEEITSICKFAVVLKAPLNIRMKRIRKREEAKFGNRVSIGGDLYESQQKFHNKVLARGEEHIAKQMQFINCPVLELDATLPVQDIVDIIYKKYTDKFY
ncbi:MAG: AAA family ATPase [Eubacterium sp.]|nr:AAA family ATPase [Eubacterium sp.]